MARWEAGMTASHREAKPQDELAPAQAPNKRSRTIDRLRLDPTFTGAEMNDQLWVGSRQL